MGWLLCSYQASVVRVPTAAPQICSTQCLPARARSCLPNYLSVLAAHTSSAPSALPPAPRLFLELASGAALWGCHGLAAGLLPPLSGCGSGCRATPRGPHLTDSQPALLPSAGPVPSPPPEQSLVEQGSEERLSCAQSMHTGWPVVRRVLPSQVGIRPPLRGLMLLLARFRVSGHLAPSLGGESHRAPRA